MHRRLEDPRLLSLGQEIVARLRSTGGRPSLTGASCKPKVSLRPADWDALKALASRISEASGRSVTPSQLAGHLLAGCLRDLPAASTLDASRTGDGSETPKV